MCMKRAEVISRSAVMPRPVTQSPTHQTVLTQSGATFISRDEYVPAPAQPQRSPSAHETRARAAASDICTLGSQAMRVRCIMTTLGIISLDQIRWFLFRTSLASPTLFSGTIPESTHFDTTAALRLRSGCSVAENQITIPAGRLPACGLCGAYCIVHSAGSEMLIVHAILRIPRIIVRGREIKVIPSIESERRPPMSIWHH